MADKIYVHYSWPSDDKTLLDSNTGALQLLKKYRQSLYKQVQRKAVEKRALKFIENFVNFVMTNPQKGQQIKGSWDEDSKFDKNYLKEVGKELDKYCHSFTGVDKNEQSLWTTAQKKTFETVTGKKSSSAISSDYNSFLSDYNNNKTQFLNTIKFLKNPKLRPEKLQEKIELAITQCQKILESFQNYQLTLRTAENFFDVNARQQVEKILNTIKTNLNKMKNNEDPSENFSLDSIKSQLIQCEKYIFNVASGSDFMGKLGEISLGKMIEDNKLYQAKKKIDSVIVGASRGKGQAKTIKKSLNTLTPKLAANKKNLKTLLGTCSISGTQDKIDILYYQNNFGKQEGVSLKTYNLNEIGSTVITVHENLSIWNILLWGSQNNVVTLNKYLNFFGSHDEDNSVSNLENQRKLACNELKAIMVYTGLAQGNLLKENSFPATVFLVLNPAKRKFYAYTISSLLPEIDNNSKISFSKAGLITAKIAPQKVSPKHLENPNRWKGNLALNEQSAADRTVEYLMALHRLKYDVTVRIGNN